MKKISLIIVASVLFGLAEQKLNAQELKFGHIDTQALIQALPEYDTAVARLERLGRELNNTYELMQVEFNNKYLAYEKEAENLLEIVRQSRSQELADLNRRMQEFQQTAGQQYQTRQGELFQPIMEKVDKAIRDVGRENGFIYIFTVGEQGSSLVYFDETKSVDIMSLAKAKLGIRR